MPDNMGSAPACTARLPATIGQRFLLPVSTAPPKAPSMPVQAQFSIDEPDNARLASLCGALDANLRTIESALDVRITRLGSTFTIETH